MDEAVGNGEMVGGREGPTLRSEWPAFQNAIKEGDAALVKKMLADGYDVETRFEGVTALTMAADRGKADCLAMLIAAGANLNASDPYGQTGVMGAAFNGHVECLSMLITAGCDINAKSEDGLTAAMGAVLNGQADCLSILINAGADLESRNENGLSASDLARSERKWQCAGMIEAEVERRALSVVVFNSKGPRSGFRV